MPTLHYRDAAETGLNRSRTVIPFPHIRLATPTGEVFGALDVVSRRMEDLARELGCLGFFEDDDDRPRAA
jgi:hypothetical protein